MTILQTEQLFTVKIPAACFLPQLGGGCDRHQHFLGACLVEFFPDDALDLTDDPKPQRQIRVDACRDLPNQTGTQH